MRLSFKQVFDEIRCVFYGWSGLDAKCNGNAKTFPSCGLVFAAKYRMHDVFGETVFGGPLPNGRARCFQLGFCVVKA